MYLEVVASQLKKKKKSQREAFWAVGKSTEMKSKRVCTKNCTKVGVAVVERAMKIKWSWKAEI